MPEGHENSNKNCGEASKQGTIRRVGPQTTKSSRNTLRRTWWAEHNGTTVEHLGVRSCGTAKHNCARYSYTHAAPNRIRNMCFLITNSELKVSILCKKATVEHRVRFTSRTNEHMLENHAMETRRVVDSLDRQNVRLHCPVAFPFNLLEPRLSTAFELAFSLLRASLDLRLLNEISTFVPCHRLINLWLMSIFHLSF